MIRGEASGRRIDQRDGGEMQVHSEPEKIQALDAPNGAAVGPAAPQGEDAPTRLLRRFKLMSVFAAAAILILAGYGIFRVYSNEMTKAAQETAVHVADSIFAQERATLLKWGGQGVVVEVTPEDFGGLDLRMKNTLRTFNMHKIKFFAADKTIVYSTDASLIGKIDADNSALDRVLAEGTVISHLEFKDTIRDLENEARFSVDVVETYVPMRMDNFIVGAFEIYTDISSTRNRVVDAITYSLGVLLLVLVVVFGSLYLPVRAAMARLSKAECRLRELASVDALTGIFNRRHVLDRVDQERARLLRTGGKKSAHCMALLMVDIDYFKKVNDAHGHLVGDEVLRETASRLNSALRPYDIIGRYGGEEFLVVLLNTDLAEGVQAGERMRARVHDQPMRIDAVALQVSVSIGVATTLDADEETAEVLKRADEALYKAKASGRNRVCSVQSAAATPG